MYSSSNTITSLQGESLNRPSKIYCFIEEDGDEYKVKVGGNANIVMEGILKVAGLYIVKEKQTFSYKQELQDF